MLQKFTRKTFTFASYACRQTEERKTLKTFTLLFLLLFLHVSPLPPPLQMYPCSSTGGGGGGYWSLWLSKFLSSSSIFHPTKNFDSSFTHVYYAREIFVRILLLSSRDSNSFRREAACCMFNKKYDPPPTPSTCFVVMCVCVYAMNWNLLLLFYSSIYYYGETIVFGKIIFGSKKFVSSNFDT